MKLFLIRDYFGTILTKEYFDSLEDAEREYPNCDIIEY